MAVARVLVLCGVWTWAAASARAEPGDGVTVKEEVERIFKSVEQFMSGNTPEVKRKFKTVEDFVSEDGTGPVRKYNAQKKNLGISEGRYRVRDPTAEHDIPEEIPVRPGTPTQDSDFIKPLTTFPLGVILSDSLYPLVVGKNVDSGKPFVMDLSKQHALVVAKTGGEDYRLMIPFPVVVGVPPGSERAGPTQQDPVGYPSHSQSYPSYPRPEDGSYHSYREEPQYPKNGPHNVQKGPRKYGPGYRPHGYRTQEEPPHHSRYPKKYTRNQNYRGYPGDGSYPRNENYNGYRQDDIIPSKGSQSHRHVKKPKEHISYHVAGPKYRRPAYLSTVKKYVPQGQRDYRGQSDKPYYSPPLHRGGDRFVQPPYGSFPTKLYPAEDGATRPFRPSPYIGNITEDEGHGPRQHYDVSDLEPQSEVFENYDDRPVEFTEQDYLDSIRDR
ncbi:hypothetical protein J6590_065981 [Homalodisca vitripennis]|nr:hypothetical protein J6590_065981 [Homalodisca vitripennis]